MRSSSGTWKFNNTIRSFYLFNIIGFNREQNFYRVRIRLVDKGIDPKWWLELTRDAVVHDRELTLWGTDLQSAVDVEFRGVDGLVEVAIVEDDEAHRGVALPNG